MSVRLCVENSCVVHSCLRPVHAAGGYCVQHWMGLSSAQRAVLEQTAPDVEGMVAALRRDLDTFA